jgi:hypothetical protein
VVVHTVHHSMPGRPRVLVSWGQGNTLRLSYLQQESEGQDEDDDMAVNPSFRDDNAGNGKVVEVKLGKRDDRPLAEKRALAYSSVQAFAFLQNQKQLVLQHDGGPSRTVTSDWYAACRRLFVIFRFPKRGEQESLILILTKQRDSSVRKRAISIQCDVRSREELV